MPKLTCKLILVLLICAAGANLTALEVPDSVDIGAAKSGEVLPFLIPLFNPGGIRYGDSDERLRLCCSRQTICPRACEGAGGGGGAFRYGRVLW